MKIDIGYINLIPSNITSKFGMCMYNTSVTNEILEWISFHKIAIEKIGIYCNFYTDKNIYDLFKLPHQFKYMDGFSPNLNKHLHIGHFSNLVLAKSFKSLNICEQTVALLGDTLKDGISSEDAFDNYKKMCHEFEYNIDKLFMASQMNCHPSLMNDGDDKYLGTKVFCIDDQKVVGIKSDGTTSYFYQDVAFASTLNDYTLYLTGSEQNNHFNLLKKLFPNIKHIGLGLVKSKGGKMSSSLGNVIYIQDVMKLLMPLFNNDIKLCYNVLAGYIFQSAPSSDKNIDLEQINNPLLSQGLYLSYTLAKLKSAGCKIIANDNLVTQNLQFKHLKALDTLSPNILFYGIVDLAKKISQLYTTNIIKDSDDNKKLFEHLGNELITGMKMLGLFDIEKV